ncbi:MULTISPECIES: YdcH family protein [Phenylobacterium]|uniref:DUF465 domain-containing protein n=1 Tax=Phenylobacterium koreense TaxID=266125 RepID=A0ABV2EIB9_9CAUL
MNDDDSNDPEARLEARLHALTQEHADLGVAVDAIAVSPVPDMMVIARLKRKKLSLKDEIERLKDQQTPDIIA